jgi:hypothetical protein
MTLDAIVALASGLAAIITGFVFGAGAPVALTVAVERARESHARSGRIRAQKARSRYPYR